MIIHGDALSVMRSMDTGSFNGVITDPPYCSGAAGLTGYKASTAVKYTNAKSHCPMPDFEGDAKDQRSWTNWCAEWLSEAKRLCVAGSPICVFCDWRQYPSLTDALQWAGWIWRGVAVWDKVSSRPQRGRFRSQCEYVIWGSNGAMPVDRDVPVLPGVFKYVNVDAAHGKAHQTQKPLELMREIVHIVEPGGRILDPFAGSGTTVLAALLEGYDAVGIELSEHYARVARERIDKEAVTCLTSLTSPALSPVAEH